MDALDRVKYVLAQLPPADQAELKRFLDGLVLSDDEKEALLAGDRPGAVATVTEGRRRGRSRSAGSRRKRGGSVTYRLEHVKCGKASCTKCPHGPYTYKYWREDGRLRKKYVGKATRRGAGAATSGVETQPGQGSSRGTPPPDA